MLRTAAGRRKLPGSTGLVEHRCLGLSLKLGGVLEDGPRLLETGAVLLMMSLVILVFLGLHPETACNCSPCILYISGYLQVLLSRTFGHIVHLLFWFVANLSVSLAYYPALKRQLISRCQSSFQMMWPVFSVQYAQTATPLRNVAGFLCFTRLDSGLSSAEAFQRIGVRPCLALAKGHCLKTCRLVSISRLTRSCSTAGSCKGKDAVKSNSICAPLPCLHGSVLRITSSLLLCKSLQPPSQPASQGQRQVYCHVELGQHH